MTLDTVPDILDDIREGKMVILMDDEDRENEGDLVIAAEKVTLLGSFQYFFYQQDLLWESARTIWIHGTIEISVIIVAGCAGVVMGNGMLFTGTLPRLESFKRGVINGLKILMSTIPFFIIAGFLEGFVTRHTEMPDWLAILIFGSSLFIILFYYVYYPIKLHRRTSQTVELKNYIDLTPQD